MFQMYGKMYHDSLKTRWLNKRFVLLLPVDLIIKDYNLKKSPIPHTSILTIRIDKIVDLLFAGCQNKCPRLNLNLSLSLIYVRQAQNLRSLEYNLCRSGIVLLCYGTVIVYFWALLGLITALYRNHHISPHFSPAYYRFKIHFETNPKVYHFYNYPVIRQYRYKQIKKIHLNLHNVLA